MKFSDWLASLINGFLGREDNGGEEE